ncbi:MAG: MFS transporter [Candidatus Kariarchaeaceae archaeon]|jgi:MFS family permease
MSFYNNFIALNQLPEQAKGIMRKYGLFRALFSSVYSASGTIFILHIIDSIGFKQASTIMAVMFFTQLIIDYPSGSLGDYIGQRMVLGIASISSAIAFYLFSVAHSYQDFIIVAVVFGFANAQSSGALQSWLDNNYKKIKDDIDKDRKNYGFTMNRFNTIDTFVMGISIMLGGFVASSISREFIFYVQSILITVIAILVIMILSDLPTEGELALNPEKSSQNYFDLLKGGISYVISRKSVLIFVLGFSVINAVWTLWGTLMLFPIYFGYTGSDSLAGVLRSSIFFIGVLLQILTANFTKRVENDKLPKFVILHFFLLFVSIASLLYYLPMQNSFSLSGFFLLMIILTVSVSLVMPFITTLWQRQMLDLIPSEFRNSIYSLIPTISGVIGVIFLPIIGGVIESMGMFYGVAIELMFGLVGSILIFVAFYYSQVEDDLTVKIATKRISQVSNHAIAD